MSQTALRNDTLLRNDNADDLDFVVDEAIRVAGGDMRSAILGLIRGQHQMEAEFGRTTTTVSAGYVRRRPR